MPITDELIETLGGGGTVGLAVAAAVLVPAIYPPARRGLREIAKAAIVQYLRVTEPRAAEAPAAEEAAVLTSAPPAAPPRRRGRPPRAASAPGAEVNAPEVRALGAEPIAAPEAPARAPRARRSRTTTPAAESTPPLAPQTAVASSQAAPETAPPAPAVAAPPPSRPERTEPAASTETPAEAPAARRGRPRANAEGIAPDGRINLNVATRAQLTRLPRIGAQTADRIIELREREGPIRNMRELRRADIITAAAAKQMRDLVRF